MHAATQAFPAWRALGLVKRAEYLLRVAQLMEEDREALAQIVAREAGKQINEARADVVEAIHTAQYAFAYGHLGQYGRVLADEVPTKRCYEVLEPRGVVVAITPWNFPVALPFWLTGLSLVVGNCVILKPSELTPLCGAKIAGYFERAGAPPGVFRFYTEREKRSVRRWSRIRIPTSCSLPAAMKSAYRSNKKSRSTRIKCVRSRQAERMPY